VLFIQIGACNIVLGGDATEETWKEIYERRRGEFPKIHLLKTSHHGRKSGYHLESVKAMNPDVTVLSVGELKGKHDELAMSGSRIKGAIQHLNMGI
jgi:competence protein ComEC